MKYSHSKDEIYSYLSQTDLFSTLDAQSLKSLIPRLEIILLNSNEVLINEGEIGNELFLVLHGRLRVTRINEGIEVTINEIGKGEIVGEVALLIEQTRSATVRATRETTLVKLSKSTFKQLNKLYPEAAMKIAQECVSRLIKSQTKSYRLNSNITCITFIPQQKNEKINSYFRELLTILKTELNVKWLTEDVLKKEISKNNITQDNFHQCLSEWELKFDLIIFEAEYELSFWTKICCQNSDCLYVITVDNEDSFKLSESELFIYHALGSKIRTAFIILNSTNKSKPNDTKKRLEERLVDDYYNLSIEDTSHLYRLCRIITGNAIGLVLSGGGARGLAHIGLIRAMEEHGLHLDFVGGVSAGALIAAAYAMELSSKDMIELCQSVLLRGSKLDLTYPFIAITSAKNLVNALKTSFGEDTYLEDLWLRTFFISTNLTKNRIKIHKDGLIWKQLRASLSLPGIYPPVFDQEGILVDGAVLNNLPINVMSNYFYASKVFASLVEVSSEVFKVESTSTSFSGWKVLWQKLNPLAKKETVPRIDDILMQSMTVNELHRQMQQLAKADYGVVMNLNEYGIMDYGAYNEIIELGYSQARDTLSTMSFSDLKFQK